MVWVQLRALMWSGACSVHHLSTLISGTSASTCLSPWGYKTYPYSWRKWWWLRQFTRNHMVNSTLCTSYFCLQSRSWFDCTYIISVSPTLTCHKQPDKFVWHLNFCSKLRFMITHISSFSFWMESCLSQILYHVQDLIMFNCIHMWCNSYTHSYIPLICRSGKQIWGEKQFIRIFMYYLFILLLTE